MSNRASNPIAGQPQPTLHSQVCRRLRACLLSILGLLPLLNLVAQSPSFQVDQIGVRPTATPGVYQFFPMYQGVACTPRQLSHHLYEWEFSPTDYSVEATPERTFFMGTPLNVRLRVGGIKEDIDPDNTPAGGVDPDPTNNIFRELPPALWTTRDIGPLAFTPSTLAQQPVTLRPAMRVLTPQRGPVPGENYPVLVELENNSLQCEFNVKVNLQLKVNGMQVPLVRNHVAQGITCNPSNASCNSFRLKLPAKQRVVIPLTGAMPAGDDLIGGSVVLGAGGYFDISGASPCTKTTDSVTVPRRLARSVDPNSKTILNGPKFLPGDLVQFSVQFHNTGNIDAHNIVVWDTLDPRFQIQFAEPIAVEVNGAAIPEGSLNNASYFLFTKNTNDRALQFKISLAATEGLGTDETGSVTFQVPIDPNLSFGTQDQWVATKDSCLRYLVLHNAAVTLFEEEGRRYGSHCVPAVKVMLRDENCCKPGDEVRTPKWAWAVMGGLLLLASLALLLRRRGKA